MCHVRMRQLNESGTPLVSYFHPYEFDSEPLNLFFSGEPKRFRQRLHGLRINFHQNLGRRTMMAKLDTLLQQTLFTTVTVIILIGKETFERKKLFERTADDFDSLYEDRYDWSYRFNRVFRQGIPTSR